MCSRDVNTHPARSDNGGLFFYGLQAYDFVPGGKLGIGVFMTILNIINMLGFVFAFFLEVTDSVSMTGLHIFMGIIGFSSVLPVSLPFLVYSMAVGGVKHCAVIVATFEFVAHVRAPAALTPKYLRL